MRTTIKVLLLTVTSFLFVATMASAQTCGTSQVTYSGYTSSYLPKWNVTSGCISNSTIFDNGNVGIGTTTPHNALEVAGLNVAAVTSGSASNSILRLQPAGSAMMCDFGVYTSTGYHSWIQSRDASNYAINYPLALNPNGGNVGIGTTSPGYLLEVAGNSSIGGKALVAGNTNEIWTQPQTNANAALYINYRGYADGTSQFRDLNISNGKAGNIAFFQGSTGNVGIGTTAPATLLHVQGIISNGTLGASGTYGVQFNPDASGNSVFNIKNNSGAIAATSGLDISTGTTSSYNSRLSINQLGNVGIGTTSPDINASGSAFKTLTILGPNTSVFSCGILEIATQSTDADANLAGVLNFAASSNASTKRSIAQIVSFTQGTTATNRGGFMIFNTKPDGSTSTLERMRIDNIGNVGIGTTLANNPNNYKLAVNGTIGAKAVKIEITSTTWPDFVFNKGYNKLKSLKEVEQYILENGHLPEIPTAKEIETNGADIGELLKLQMKKIEELTLYIIEQNKRILALESK